MEFLQRIVTVYQQVQLALALEKKKKILNNNIITALNAVLNIQEDKVFNILAMVSETEF